jgi:sn-glycerol 3-phosphate transport system substrate-binding protein
MLKRFRRCDLTHYRGIAFTPLNQVLAAVATGNGGQEFRIAGGQRVFDLDNRGAAAALTMMRDWVKNGEMILTTGYQYQVDFDTGNIGMVIDQSADYSYDKDNGGKFVMGGVPLPQGNSGDPPALEIAGASLVMFNTGTAVQKNAAWTFMKWVSSPAVNVYWDEHTNYIGCGSSRGTIFASYPIDITRNSTIR